MHSVLALKRLVQAAAIVDDMRDSNRRNTALLDIAQILHVRPRTWYSAGLSYLFLNHSSEVPVYESRLL